MRLAISLLLAALALGLAPAVAEAHGGPPSVLNLRPMEGGVDVELKVTAALLAEIVPALAALGPGAPAEAAKVVRENVEAYLSRQLRIERGGRACRAQWSGLAAAAGGRLVARGRYHCDREGSLLVAPALFVHDRPQHRVLVMTDLPGGGHRTDSVVVHSPELRVPLAAPSWVGLVAGFFADGVRHILGGADHVLFVLGLVLVTAAKWRRLLLAVTGFTVAHTLTLVLSTVGQLRIDGAVVEPLIGLSIAYLGYEALVRDGAGRWLDGVVLGAHAAVVGAVFAGLLNVPPTAAVGLGLFATGFAGWLREHPADWVLVGDVLFPFLFGLAHGLGFAGPLMELALPGGQLAAAIVAFNLGVEAGQILILAAILAAAGGLARVLPAVADRLGRSVAVAAAAALLAVGGAWFALRSLPGGV